MKDLYEKERDFLAYMKELVDSPDERDWHSDLQTMVGAYEALLSATIKMHRISDRSSAWLIEVQGKLKTANQVLEVTSSVDPLTGLLNRRKIEEILQAEQSRFNDTGSPCSMISIDLDHFKTINDTYGHNTGDEVLVVFARVLKNRIRATDCGARWGGDEFLVVLPNTAEVQARSVSEAIRQAVEATAFPVSPVPVSLGVAELTPGMSREAWLLATDRSLYQAKNAGRNQTGRSNPFC